MRILEINKFNFGNGGADRHFMDLCEMLKANGHEVAEFCMEHSKNSYTPFRKYFMSYVGYRSSDKIWARIIGLFRIFYSFEAKRKIRQIIADFQPDIVHIHNIYHQISPSILPEIKKFNLPVVMTIHDYHIICPDYLMYCNGLDWGKIKNKGFFYFVINRCFKNSMLASAISYLTYKWQMWLQIYEKNVDLFLSPSESAKNILIQNGIDQRKVVVLPHFTTENKLGQNEIGESHEKYALYFGKISKEKGCEKMIEAFDKLDGISLYLAGEIENGFKMKIKDKNIKYLGVLNPFELERYIKGSEFVVSFSLLPETFGLIALEAIKNSKPFISLDRGGYKEIIENNVSGYICADTAEMSQKIKKLASNEHLRIQFSKNAFERSKGYDSNIYYKKLTNMFERAQASVN